MTVRVCDDYWIEIGGEGNSLQPVHCGHSADRTLQAHGHLHPHVIINYEQTWKQSKEIGCDQISFDWKLIYSQVWLCEGRQLDILL